MATITTHEFIIPTDGARLQGDLCVPAGARAVVIFAHGSGSSRLSPRNREVAMFLQKHSFATLLFDLLTPQEDRYYRNRFAIDLLKDRLVIVTRRLKLFPDLNDLPMAYFGASTGAAAALKAAAELPGIFAVVSRGGRPDLAMHDLHEVKAPTLLVVGGADQQVLTLNRLAYRELRCQKKLEIVPDASHLFDEPGALDKVAQLAAGWFTSHLPVKVIK